MLRRKTVPSATAGVAQHISSSLFSPSTSNSGPAFSTNVCPPASRQKILPSFAQGDAVNPFLLSGCVADSARAVGRVVATQQPAPFFQDVKVTLIHQGRGHGRVPPRGSFQAICSGCSRPGADLELARRASPHRHQGTAPCHAAAGAEINSLVIPHGCRRASSSRQWLRSGSVWPSALPRSPLPSWTRWTKIMRASHPGLTMPSTHRKFAGRGCLRTFTEWCLPRHSRPAIGPSRPAACGAGSKAKHSAHKLGAAQTENKRGLQAIDEAFVAGYRAVLWVAAGLALASSLSAAVMIKAAPRSERTRLAMEPLGEVNFLAGDRVRTVWITPGWYRRAHPR